MCATAQNKEANVNPCWDCILIKVGKIVSCTTVRCVTTAPPPAVFLTDRCRMSAERVPLCLNILIFFINIETCGLIHGIYYVLPCANSEIFTTYMFRVTGRVQQIDITGLVGDSIKLPCEIDEDKCGEVHNIQWYRGDGDTRVFIYSELADVDTSENMLEGRSVVKALDTSVINWQSSERRILWHKLCRRVRDCFTNDGVLR